MKKMRTSALIALLLGTTSCSDSGFIPELNELARNLELWTEVAPERYVYAVERICFCGFRGPARVTVEAGEVVSVEWVDPAPDLPEPTAELFPGVEGLFEILAEAMTEGAHSIEVTYDPSTGVPTSFSIDRERNVADEELGMRVTEPVRALPAGP